MEKIVHIVANGKGGCGKSTVATILYQVLKSAGKAPLGIDTDPVNDTFHRHQGIESKLVGLLGDDKKLNTRAFDEMVDWIVAHDGDVVIDNGAASFFPVIDYMVACDLVDELKAENIKVVMHVPLEGGQGAKDTIQGLQTILKEINAEAVVWKNEFRHGEVTYQGKTFEQSETAKNFAKQIRGTIVMPSFDHDTFGEDIRQMSSHNMTFDEAINSADFGRMMKSRLKKVWEYYKVETAKVIA